MSRGLKTNAQSAPVIDMKAGGEIVAIQHGQGHNSVSPEARRWLASIVTAIEREDEVIGEANRVKAARYRAVKAAGIDPNALRAAIRWRGKPEQYDARNGLAQLLRTVLDEELGTKPVDIGQKNKSRARASVVGGGAA